MATTAGRERGSAAPLLALLVVLAGALVLGMGRVGGVAVASARARTAADAAALAGAADGRDAASTVAAANGARMVRFQELGLDTRVVVQVGRAMASARAHRAATTAAVGSTARASTEGLTPAMLAALARAQQLLGGAVPITSGWRSPAEQAALWAARASNPFLVAPPGASMHERGLAVDVPVSFVPRLLTVADAVGLCHPFPLADPVHFELCR